MVTGTVSDGENNGGSLETAKRPANEHRRSNKPIMEKRRRARINNCLNELKALILEAMKKDPARHSKLEKADILEMTVKHLETLQKQRSVSDAESQDRFRAGYHECVHEVSGYQEIENDIRRKLVQHLNTRLEPVADLQDSEDHSQGAIYLSTGANSGVRLVPTRLANGDIALVVPQTSIKTFSTTSSVSSMSIDQESTSPVRCFSPLSTWSGSPPPQEQAPLSLVIRGRREYPEDKPWRPW